MEGDTVILNCKYMATLYDNVISEFYKNELLIGRSSTGNMTIYRVSKCDEGLYKCNISGAGESPDSWMTVRGKTIIIIIIIITSFNCRVNFIRNKCILAYAY